MRLAKLEATRDMTDNLLRKYPDFPKDKVRVDEMTLPDGRVIVKVALREGFNDIDWQTATIETQVVSTITRTADLPDYHPDYAKNEERKRRQQQLDQDEW